MKGSTMFRLTATVTLIQIALGGLVTFGFIDAMAHITLGFPVAVVAIMTATVAFRSQLSDRQLRGVGFGIVAAVIVQGILDSRRSLSIATLSPGYISSWGC